jgi:hypothetical protein
MQTGGDENIVLRRMFEPKRDGGLSKLYVEGFPKFVLIFLNIVRGIKSKRIRRVLRISCMKWKRNVCKGLVRKLDGKRELACEGIGWK